MNDELGDVFSEMVESLKARHDIRERHRAECRRRPCERCEIWVCEWIDGAKLCGADSYVPQDDRDGHERPALCELHLKLWERRPRIDEARKSIPEAYRTVSGGFIIPKRSIQERCRTFATLRKHLAPIVSAKKSMVLYGSSGEGKTSAAAYLMQWVIDQGMKETSTHDEVRRAMGCLFMSSEHISLARMHQAYGKAEHPDITRAIRAELLLLDDMGREADGGRQALGYVISERYNRGAETWVTTGIDRAVFGARFDGGTERRLTEGGTWINMHQTT